MRALQLKGRGSGRGRGFPVAGRRAALIGPRARGGASGAALPAGRPGNGGGPRVEAAGAAPAHGGRRRPAHPLPLLALLQRAPALRGARRSAPEAGHPGALPVRGHGRGRALRQLHVLRGQAALVCPGGRAAAGGGHLRRPRRGPRPLRRLAQGADVLAHHRHHRRVPDPGQRRGGAVPAETTEPLPAVHGTGVPGHLPHLPGNGAGGQPGQPEAAAASWAGDTTPCGRSLGTVLAVPQIVPGGSLGAVPPRTSPTLAPGKKPQGSSCPRVIVTSATHVTSATALRPPFSAGQGRCAGGCSRCHRTPVPRCPWGRHVGSVLPWAPVPPRSVPIAPEPSPAASVPSAPLSPPLSPRPTRCSTAPRTAWPTWTTCWGGSWPCSCCSCSTGCWRWPSCRATTCGRRRRCWPCCCPWPSCSSMATWATGTPCAASSSGTR